MSTTPDITRFATDPVAFLESLIIPSAHGPRRFGEVMADFQRADFRRLAPALLSLARGQKPKCGRYWWERTKGASKDSDLAACLLWLLAFSPRPLECQVGAADRDQADELRKACRDILRLNRWLGEMLGVELQVWTILNAKTGSRCEIIAADVAGSHGSRPDLLILNELSHIAKWEFAENLLDNAAKVPHGLVCVATNAGFVDTPQWTLREIARQSPRWTFRVFDQPAPWIDAAELAERARATSAARYNRLWHGVWASGEGDALDGEDIQAALTLDGPLLVGVKEFQPYLGALDLGLRNDRSALVVVGLDVARQRVCLMNCQSWAPPRVGGQVSLEEVKHACLAANRVYDLSAIIYDPWQAELMAEQLRAAGVRTIQMPFVPKTLDRMATTLLRVFRNRRIDLYDDRELIRDLRRLVIVERQSGFRLQATRDSSGHADKAIALSMALPIAEAWMKQIAADRTRGPEIEEYAVA